MVVFIVGPIAAGGTAFAAWRLGLFNGAPPGIAEQDDSLRKKMKDMDKWRN